MEDEHMEGTTPDNTKVMRIMGDFHQFLSTQRRATTSGSSPYSSSIPFHLPKEDNELDTSRSTMALTSEQKLNIDLKVKIKQMEADHSSSKKAHTKANIKLEAQCEKLNFEILNLKEKYNTLQLKNKHLMEQSLELLDKVKEAEKEKNDGLLMWESSYNQLEKMKQEYDEKVTDAISTHVAKNKQLLDQNLSLQSQTDMMSLRLEEAYAHMDVYKKRAEESTTTLEEHKETAAKLLNAEQRINELSTRLANVEDAEKIAQSFKEDMNRLRLLEAEYRRLTDENYLLRSNQENIALLNEKLLSAESKLSRAESRCARIDELETANQNLSLQLQNNESQIIDNATLCSLHYQTSELQHHVRMLEERNSTQLSEHSILNKKHSEQVEKNKILSEKISEREESMSSITAQLQRLRKRCSLLAHERDSIRAILQSYDAELTMTSHTTQLSKRLNNAQEANRRLHTRIEQLELELLKKGNTTSQIDQAKQAAGQMTTGDGDSTKQLSMMSDDAMQHHVKELEEKVKERDNVCKTLSNKVELLEAWIEQRKVKGDYNPENTKVIHFTMNPADMAHQKSKTDVANLKQENAKLKQKIKQLQEGHEVSISEIEAPQHIRDQLSVAELRNQRLKEVFSKKIQEFRQACYALFGFRIDSSGDAKFKLVSMYAESEQNFLLFEMKPDGIMQLLETEYSKELNELIELHLHHQQSIPMFLSALSVELFGQQTMMSV